MSSQVKSTKTLQTPSKDEGPIIPKYSKASRRLFRVVMEASPFQIGLSPPGGTLKFVSVPKEAMDTPSARIEFINRAANSMIDLNLQTGLALKRVGEEGLHEVSKWQKRTRQTTIVLQAALTRFKRFSSLSKEEAETEIMWLRIIYWDGGFAKLQYEVHEAWDAINARISP